MSKNAPIEKKLKPDKEILCESCEILHYCLNAGKQCKYRACLVDGDSPLREEYLADSTRDNIEARHYADVLAEMQHARSTRRRYDISDIRAIEQPLRRAIAAMAYASMPVHQIAATLGMHRATLYRIIRNVK